MAMSNGESMIERSIRQLAEWSARLKRSGLRRWRLLGLLSAMVVVVALPYLIVRASTADVRDAEAWVTHSAEVTSLVYRIAFEVRDSEAAIYRLLDGEDSANLRQRASLAAADTPALVLRLHAMTADNPAQQAAVGALDRRVNGRLALIRQALLRYEEGDRAGALAALRDADVLYRLTDQIGTILGNEGKLLSERRAASAQRAFRSNVILGVTCVAQLLLLAIIVLVSEWQIGRRIEAEAAENRAVQRALMILEAVREPIALLDDELRILLANAAFRELYGLPEGVRPTLMEAGDGAWADNGLQRRLRDVLLRDRELWDYELTQRTMDGMERRVVINARRLEQEGDTAPVLLALKRLLAMRAYKRCQQVEGREDLALLQRVGLWVAQVEEMYRYLAIANYEDRFVIPSAHREYAEDAFDLRGVCGFSFGNGCSDGPSEASLFGGTKKRTIPIAVEKV
jgi:PAS domain-containing protein